MGVCSQAWEQILITSDEIPKRKYCWLALVQAYNRRRSNTTIQSGNGNIYLDVYRTTLPLIGVRGSVQSGAGADTDNQR